MESEEPLPPQLVVFLHRAHDLSVGDRGVQPEPCWPTAMTAIGQQQSGRDYRGGNCEPGAFGSSAAVGAVAV